MMAHHVNSYRGGRINAESDSDQPLLSGLLAMGQVYRGSDHDSHGARVRRFVACTNQSRLTIALVFVLVFMVVEILGGVIANSLALITDAAHMLSDAGGFIVSLVSLQIAEQCASGRHTYGYRQAEVLGALLSIMIVWAMTAILLWEALPRFVQPEEIAGQTMFTVSVAGIAVNLLVLQIIGPPHWSHRGEDDRGHISVAANHANETVALKAAIAHVIGDIFQSIGVCVASVLIWLKPVDVGSTGGVSNWNYADPCSTVLFSIIVLCTTKSTLVYTIQSLMVRAPDHIDLTDLRQKLEWISHVDSIHDLHVWSLGSSEFLCTAHLMLNDGRNSTEVLRAAISIAHEAGIGHATFQIEIVGEFDPSRDETGLHDTF
eukprot:TRINITY_DN15791_c0_g2_i1.p1 TRINITY_DN15791_c0_g2~~TRINITY_DN15791_c0_g2_i1.p1  ORF type:complete len:375 (+),score=39.11 TRINITY_DN15791_c0_g2_i1:88-1212(+)